MEDCGWQLLAYDPALARWADAARNAGRVAVADPQNAHWHQCEGTWFVGVDALPNDAQGGLADTPLKGAAVDAANALFGPLALHRAQLSVVYEGYPKPRNGESDAGFRYRLNRDAAHLDGLKLGAERRRFMQEYHAWILGIPLTPSAPGASPLVIWEGSHKAVQAMLKEAFDGLPPERWGEVDLTDRYSALRKEIFERYQRVEIAAQPGEAYLVHRFALHGVAPWAADESGPEEGRMIAYFRPDLADREAWLNKA